MARFGTNFYLSPRTVIVVIVVFFSVFIINTLLSVINKGLRPSYFNLGPPGGEKSFQMAENDPGVFWSHDRG